MYNNIHNTDILVMQDMYIYMVLLLNPTPGQLVANPQSATDAADTCQSINKVFGS